jgi:hypothetical protein
MHWPKVNFEPQEAPLEKWYCFEQAIVDVALTWHEVSIL